MKTWLRPAEFAEAIGVSKKTIYKRIKEGKIKNVRRDGRKILLIHVSELERYGNWDRRGRKPSFTYPV